MKSTKIADYRHRVVIQKPVETRNDHGETILSWLAIENGSRWAAIEPLSGRELFEAQQVTPLVTHRINVRHLDGVTSRMRIKNGNRIFNIGSVLNLSEQDRELQLTCIEAIS